MTTLAAGDSPVVPTSLPASTFQRDVRAVRIVWRRELSRFADDRIRMITQLVQPLLFLFILGTGLSTVAGGSTHGVSFRTFIYPGILCMAVMLTAMFSAASIVWDREFGFLREMLVAPVRRSSIIVGKCLGGATVAGIEGLVVVALGPLVGVPYNLGLILEIIALQLLLSFSITAFGLLCSVRLTQITSFMALSQMLIMPMFFISGALFPINNLPPWLTLLNRIDPITYVVIPMRHAVFDRLTLTPAGRAVLEPQLTWFGWTVPIWLQVAVVMVLGLALLAAAAIRFARKDG
jgi:ABC-2 type transport system permease protein